jgi:hypothetical protein
MPSKSKCFLAILAILVLVPLAYSQDVRASITGQITDPTGAAVAGATVHVTNVATSTVISAKSNETGTFATPFLAPGQYEITVEASGFKKFVRQNIALQAQDKFRLDVKMEVGDVTTSVTVADQASQLQTETASRSQVLASEIVANMPTQGRNPFQIAWAAAGVIKGTGWRYLRSFDIGGTTSITINGGREGQNEVLLDGISNVRAEWTVISIPTTESIQEFKVQSATYDAQYGRTSGGVITMVTKGGGNSFHGTAFEYFQNERLNANQTELNRPLTLAGQYFPNGRKGPNHINQFGAQASGPIIIPKVFNGKNRVFWMLSWESMRQRSADPGVVTFPTMAIRGGDFTSLLNASGQQMLIYDPYSTKADGSRTPIVGNKIPSSQIDPVAAKVMSYYPAPSSVGTNAAQINNNPFPSMWIASFDQFVGRTDVVINSKNNIFFRYNENPFQEYRAIVFGLTNPAEPTGNGPLLRNGRNVMMDWTSTVSPTMTFDLRVGLNRWEESGGSTIGAGYDPKQLGIDPSLVAQFTAYQFPVFSMEGYQGLGSSAVSPGIRDSYSVQPNFNKVVGRHFMKFGVEGRRYNRGNYGGGQPSGGWSFNKNWTQANALRSDAVSGNGLATMLLGIPSGAYVQKNIDPYYKHDYYAGFFQDDWKINSRLTMNVGLRWDAETGNVERYDRQINGLDWNAASPIASKVTGLTLKGAVQFAGVGGVPRSLIDTDKNNWQPRIGLAYRLGEKWVLRGGYGLYYTGEDALGSTNGFSRQTNAIVSTDGLVPYPGMKTANPFVALPGGKLLDPIGASLGASSFLGEGVSGFMRDRGMPYSHQYSFDIQRELPGSVLVEVGYTGNTTRRLPVAFGLNFMPASEYAKRTSTGAIDTAYYLAQVPNPMAGLIPNNASLNGATVQRPVLWYAYPHLSPSISSVPIGRAQYHGVNVKFTKRMSHGLSFLSSFSTGKNLRETRILNAPDFGGLSNWESTKLVKESDQNVDIPKKFVIAGIYELPFGKGKPLAADVPGIVNQIIGGWQLNWDVTYQSGMVTDYPNALQNAPGSAKIDKVTMTQAFNTSLWKKADGTAVALPESYTLRNFPYLFSDVRRPGYQNWDASLSKYFPIHENVKLQFRFEMVNMMNHPFMQNLASVDVTNAAFGQLSPNQANLPRFVKLAMHLNW